MDRFTVHKNRSNEVLRNVKRERDHVYNEME